MSNSKAAKKAELVIGYAMTATERALSLDDIECLKSATEARSALIAVLRETREPSHMEKPEDGECMDFYNAIETLSFEAFCGKTSTEGSPDGKPYDVKTLLELSPELTPAWAKVKGSSPRNGTETIKQYYQRGRGDWKKSLKRSWEGIIKAEEMLFGDADTRTRGAVEIIIADQQKQTKRFQKLDPDSGLDFEITKAVKMSNDLIDYLNGKVK
jgi:hypothetical protein